MAQEIIKRNQHPVDIEAPVAKLPRPSGGRQVQLKNYACTIFIDCYENDKECVADIDCIGEDCDYAVFGLELTEKKRYHFQGYCMFTSRVRLDALKKRYHPTIHWEPARQDWETNYKYCTKTDKSPMEYGVRPQVKDNGDREKSRWTAARRLAREFNFDAIDDHIAVSCYRNLKAIAADNTQCSLELPSACGYWFYGVAGSGKSTKARSFFNAQGKVYLKALNKWWDGYTSQEVVVIEDIDRTHSWMAHHLKIWADKFPFPSEIKGGSMQIRPSVIVVTSNYSIEEIFGVENNDIPALKRRFKVEHFPFPYGSDGNTQEVVEATPVKLTVKQPIETFVPPPLELRRSKTISYINQPTESKGIDLSQCDEEEE